VTGAPDAELSALLRVFEGLTRCAPGDAAMLAPVVAGLPLDSVVLDAGCGRGADLPVLLAAVPRGRVVAVDLAAPFIAEVRATHPEVEAHVCDMLAPPGGPFDLIWAGGSAYGPGGAACLEAWRGGLRPGGRVALTELCWRVPDPPRAARDFWAGEYPAMGDAADLDRVIARSGYRQVHAGWLPDTAWAAYYGPLAARLDALAGDPDPAMQAAILGLRREIAIWREHGASFGYRLVVCAQQV